MKRTTTIELHKENMKFSAGHFTIFSATEREPLHGHNYTVYVSLRTEIEDNGLSFDYRFYKKKIYELCQQLNQTMLIPTQSDYLTLEEDDDYHYVIFNQQKMPFLKFDVTFLDVCNITVEELSYWLLNHLIADNEQIKRHHISAIEVKVFSGPGQSGSAHWHA